MAAAPTLIYCGGNNKRFAQIALDAGYEYGARLPGVINYRLYFADQDWKRPNRAAYMRSLAVHRPVMATVLDWERSEQLGEVLDWGEEASRFVDQIVIIPKVINEVWRLPRYIGGKRVVLAYSVPTAYGGTQVPSWDFAGWPVHILGGTPHKQMEVYRYLRHTCEIVSVDGNSPQKLAMLTCFWVPGTARHAKNRYWPQLKEMGEFYSKDAIYEAFARSCANIKQAWSSLIATTPPEPRRGKERD